MAVDAELLEILACPLCKEEVKLISLPDEQRTRIRDKYRDKFRDEEPVVIYHSHTATEAYPSRTDIDLAQEPGAHYVLVSTRDGADSPSYDGPVEFRSYRIIDGAVTEEEVKVVAGHSNQGDN